MTDTEFRDWLADEVVNRRMTPTQRDDLLAQKTFFEMNRTFIEQRFPDKAVGYVNGTMHVAETIHELFSAAASFASNRMVYFEPIGFSLY